MGGARGRKAIVQLGRTRRVGTVSAPDELRSVHGKEPMSQPPTPGSVRPRQVHPPQGLRLFHATLGRGHLHGPMNAVDLTVQTRTAVAHLAPGALLSGGAGGFRGRNKRWGPGGRAVTQRRAASAGWSG